MSTHSAPATRLRTRSRTPAGTSPPRAATCAACALDCAWAYTSRVPRHRSRSLEAPVLAAPRRTVPTASMRRRCCRCGRRGRRTFVSRCTASACRRCATRESSAPARDTATETRLPAPAATMTSSSSPAVVLHRRCRAYCGRSDTSRPRRVLTRNAPPHRRYSAIIAHDTTTPHYFHLPESNRRYSAIISLKPPTDKAFVSFAASSFIFTRDVMNLRYSATVAHVGTKVHLLCRLSASVCRQQPRNS